MKDDYILLLLRRPSKQNILDDVLSNIDLTILKEKTLNLLSTINMENPYRCMH